MSELKEIIKALVEFRNNRDWEKFHDSKNLALALSIEAAELNEIFLWKKDSETEMIDKEKLKEELADVFAFGFLLAAKHGFDVKQIILDKIAKNNNKYPVEKSKGVATKYDEL